MALPAMFLCSCGSNNEVASQEKNDSTVVTGTDTITFTIEPISRETYCARMADPDACNTEKAPAWVNDSLVDAALIKDNPGLLKRMGYDIEVTTQKGKQRFKSKVDHSGMSDDVEQYFVNAVYKNLVVFSIYYYESYAYAVLDLNTEQVFYTWGRPVPDSDEKRVIAGNTDLVAGFTNNGLQLYAKDSTGKWQLEMEKILDDWGPDALIWTGDNEVLGKKMTATMTDLGDVYKTEYIKVLLKQEKMN